MATNSIPAENLNDVEIMFDGSVEITSTLYTGEGYETTTRYFELAELEALVAQARRHATASRESA